MSFQHSFNLILTKHIFTKQKRFFIPGIHKGFLLRCSLKNYSKIYFTLTQHWGRECLLLRLIWLPSLLLYIWSDTDKHTFPPRLEGQEKTFARFLSRGPKGQINALKYSQRDWEATLQSKKQINTLEGMFLSASGCLIFLHKLYLTHNM